MIQNIADSRPKVRYIIAVDDSKSTMEEIVKVRLHLYAASFSFFIVVVTFALKKQSIDESVLIIMCTVVLLVLLVFIF